MSRGWRPFRNQDAFALFGCLVPVVVFFAHSSPAAATSESVGRAVPARGVLDDGGRTPAPKHWRRAAVGTREDRFSS